MVGELAVLRLVQLDEEVQAAEEQPAVLQTEGGREQALLGLDEPAAVVVWVQRVRVEAVEAVEDIEYVAVVFAGELDVVDVVLAVVATAATAAAVVAVVVSAIFVAAVVVVPEEAFEEQHCLWKGGLVVRIAQLMEPALSAEVDKASPT
jgi:hypothetical protein